MIKQDREENRTQPKARESLAKWVIGGTIGGLIALAVVFIVLAGDKQDEAAEKVFSMLVPLFGSWVGTVLAYYFSGENFERANRSVSRLVDQVTDQKLRSISVAEAMIPRASMSILTLPAGNDGSAINLQTGLIDRFFGPVTRIPVVDEHDVARYLIHQSLIFKYVTEQAMDATAAGRPFNVKDLTLNDFLGQPDLCDMAATTMAFVALNSNLAEAKQAMEAVPKCQDVLVTEDGSHDKPVKGWLTNVDISKKARA